eukprot:CAMPEP_0198737718 /NCGR_PEP_ID=MMETSP1475-20131203/68011_1 /TAXON_ID= ORGANISM="Unidentified sp., Strain CCMP1999" /NCGR_SAMPLE_ID=MMETSP1475 /ASSEMBLY_ACC=CAM_ASM_001111 /LENGTH=225 /DNA_ID=CAMNT_0044501587 /DNA_START=949 /DNA_END=1626 /DNA_ORIENTATION=-
MPLAPFAGVSGVVSAAITADLIPIVFRGGVKESSDIFIMLNILALTTLTLLLDAIMQLFAYKILFSTFRAEPWTYREAAALALRHCLKAWAILLIWQTAMSVGFVLFIIPGVIVLLWYKLALVVLADDPYIGVFTCMKKSKELITGNMLRVLLVLILVIGSAYLMSTVAAVTAVLAGVRISERSGRVISYAGTLIAAVLFHPLVYSTNFSIFIECLRVTSLVGEL